MPVDDELENLVSSVATPEEQLIFLTYGKISQSMAQRIFNGNIPDKYKDVVISDEDFKKLMNSNKRPEADNMAKTSQEEKKEEAKLELPTEEIPSISEVEEEKAQPQEQPKEEDKIVKVISKSLDIDEVATQIMLQRLQSLASKGNNLNDTVNILANLKKVGGEVTSKTADIVTSEIAKKLMEDLKRRYNRMSPQEILDYMLVLKLLSSLEDKGEKGEGEGLKLSDIVTLIKLLTPQQGSSDDVMKMILQMQQQQFQLIMELMKSSSSKPKEEDKSAERIAQLLDSMHKQYQELIDRLNKEKEERDKMWMETIKTAIEKLAESKETTESIKKQVSEILQSNKVGAASVDDLLKLLESLKESSKKILESSGYEVKPKEENKGPLDNPLVAKLVESLLGYISDPQKIRAMMEALGRAPQPTNIEVGEEMPHL
jgi:hypothetical protein